MPATCIFRLNGKRMSTLDCVGLGAMPAFSGNDVYINDPKSTAVAKNGPIPRGTYYIVDRRSGGRHGRMVDALEDAANGTHRADWFSLYTANPPGKDFVIVNGVRRDNFRIHPVGYWGVSLGCITLPSVQNFYSLRRWLKSRGADKIPGTQIEYYGVVTVL
jgi:hypothetical protein